MPATQAPAARITKANGATAPATADTYHPALGIQLIESSPTNPRKHFNPAALAELYLPPNVEHHDWGRNALHKTIDKMPMAAIPRFLFDCAHEPIINADYGSNDDFRAIDALFTRYGIDQKAIRARLAKEDKAKAATAAAIKVPTPPAVAKGAKTWK